MAKKGMSGREMADILKVKPSTVRSWIPRAADHSEKVNEVILKDVEIAESISPSPSNSSSMKAAWRSCGPYFSNSLTRRDWIRSCSRSS